MSFLAEIVYGRWRMGIGDPTVMGWITVFAYFLTAALCWFAVKRHKENGREFSFWLLLSILFILLGINKQLDLQTLLTEIGRDVSKRQGWYESRRTVQKIFLVIIGLGSLGVILFVTKFYNKIWQNNKLATAGLVFLCAFILIRAMSFHGFDNLINVEIIGIKINWFLELGGIGLVLAGVLKNRVTGKNTSEVQEES